jgi:hypothetical protein
MANLLQGSTWTGWVIRCIHTMIQTLFPNNNAVFQNNAPIHIDGTVQSLFEEHGGEL